MSEPIILSDEEDQRDFSTPLLSKRRRTSPDQNPNPVITVISIDDDPTPHKSAPTSTATFVPETSPDQNPNPVITVISIDDDPTPHKSAPTSTATFVPETPMSDVTIVKILSAPSDLETRTWSSEHKFFGIEGLICLESDDESEGGPGTGRENSKENENGNGRLDAVDSDWNSRSNEPICLLDLTQMSEDSELRLVNETISGGFHAVDPEWSSRFIESIPSSGHATDLTKMSEDSCLHPTSLHNETAEVCDISGVQDISIVDTNKIVKTKNARVNAKKQNNTSDTLGRQKITKEERIRLMEEKKLKKLQDKLHKEALKSEAAELKKMEKEKKRFENGKLALKYIVAEIDAKVIEWGPVGGTLLTRFAEKGLTYRIMSNPIERSIIWTMNVPENIPLLSSKGIEIPYILLVYEAEEFCNLVSKESLMSDILGVQSRYPSHTVCYLTNRLLAYINKREQELYKNPTNESAWRLPPVEEVLAKLTTHFAKVHSRQCVDEAELAEHVVGLTCSLASCQFRKKLTRLSINANGSIIPKDSDRTLIKSSLWLKALVAIPKVQPRFAIAIWKKYPTMKSLLSVYMDPSKSLHDKEFLLKDLIVEGLVSEERRLGEVCSKRVFRILMAQSGCIKTDDVEEGADFFRCQ